MRNLFVAATLSVLVACNQGVPLPTVKPTAPAESDPRFLVEPLPAWTLIGDAATKGNDDLAVVVHAPTGTKVVDVWVGDLPPVRLTDYGQGKFGDLVHLTDLPAGTHEVLLSADGSRTALAKLSFRRSAPYYVLVSTDWDFSDPGANANHLTDLQHQHHPELRITHFVGPYTFTDPAVSAARQTELTTWLLSLRDTFHDELGLHIHPYCNFVTHAGVTCVTNQSVVYAAGDSTGYTIKLGAYDRPTMGRLLAHAKELFTQHGLNVPKTFRAGAWTATLDTLGALADQGFTADTSALNWARIEEWQGYELYTWTQQHWGPIGDTTQPYWPSQADALSSQAPAVGLLEVPDNGVMIDYVSLQEMTGLFDANWNGQPLAKPVTLMMGYHPSVHYGADDNDKVEGFLTYADAHLAARDLGPVVYVTLADVAPVFAKP